MHKYVIIKKLIEDGKPDWVFGYFTNSSDPLVFPKDEPALTNQKIELVSVIEVKSFTVYA